MATVVLYSTVLDTIRILILENHVQKRITTVLPLLQAAETEKNSFPQALWVSYLVFVVLGYYLLWGGTNRGRKSVSGLAPYQECGGQRWIR